MTRRALALVRAWVRLYTRGVAPDARAARRAEIDSDLYEHERAARERGRRPAVTALEILMRMALGVAADVWWRLEHRGARRGSAERLVAARRHAWLVMPTLSAVIYATGWLGLGVPPDVGTAERAAMGLCALLVAAGVASLVAHRAPRLALALVALGALPVSLALARHAPLVPLFALLAVRSAQGRARAELRTRRAG
jgi:hypothetical protein